MSQQLMIIPEFILHQNISAALQFVRDDFNRQADETKTYLYLMLNGAQFERYNLYEQAKSIILTTEENPRHLSIDLMFNRVHDNVPAIHITLPSEQSAPSANGLGTDENDEFTDDDFTPNGDFNFDHSDDFNNGDSSSTIGSYRNTYGRTSQATYNFVIFSDNSNEAIFLMHFIKGLCIASIQSLHMAGLRNISIGAGDLQPYNDISPNLFQRVVSLNLQYTSTVPSLWKELLPTQIEYHGKMVQNV